VHGGFGAGVSVEGLRKAPGMGGRRAKTVTSFPVEVHLDGPGIGVEGGSGEGEEDLTIRLASSCEGIMGVVGVEMKLPTILDACG